MVTQNVKEYNNTKTNRKKVQFLEVDRKEYSV